MKKIITISLIIAISFFTGMHVHGKFSGHSKSDAKKIDKAGKASWYSKKSPGIRLRTANNEIFNDRSMTCAMWDAPFNQKIKVTNKENGKSIIVRVNDRGPHKRYVRRGRVIDLTRNAFKKIGSLKKGLIDVELEFL